MDELLAGRLTFKVKNSQGNIVNGTVVQYQSGDYYVQADGSLLWQVQPIQHSSNTLTLSPSQTITSGFSLVDVEIKVLGAYIRGTNNILVDYNGKIVVYYKNGDVEYGLAQDGDVYITVSSDVFTNDFRTFGSKQYASAQSEMGEWSADIGGVHYDAYLSGYDFVVSPAVTNIYNE